MVGPEHHLAILEQFDAGMQFVHTSIGKGGLPDQEPDLDRQIHELVEALAELVGYRRVELRERFRR